MIYKTIIKRSKHIWLTANRQTEQLTNSRTESDTLVKVHLIYLHL